MVELLLVRTSKTIEYFFLHKSMEILMLSVGNMFWAQLFKANDIVS